MKVREMIALSTMPNITVNHSLPMASDDPAAGQSTKSYDIIAEVVLKILVPLFILGTIGIIIMCSRRKKKKVQCVKMIENPYFSADVETPKEHKDPDVKANVEHKDPGTNIPNEKQETERQKPKGTKLMTI